MTFKAPTGEFGLIELRETNNGRWGFINPSLAFHFAFLVELTLNFKWSSSGAY